MTYLSNQTTLQDATRGMSSDERTAAFLGQWVEFKKTVTRGLQIPAHTIGTLQHCTNAGFRGQEWTVHINGRAVLAVHGVGEDLLDLIP